MSEYRTSGEIEIPADDLWAALRDFGKVSFLPRKTEVTVMGEGVGMSRTISAPPLPTVTEQLDAIDDEGRAIHYHVVGANPLPVRDYTASMKVVDLGNGRSRLEWSSIWEPDGVTEEQAREAVAQLYKGILEAMARRLTRS